MRMTQLNYPPKKTLNHAGWVFRHHRLSFSANSCSSTPKGTVCNLTAKVLRRSSTDVKPGVQNETFRPPKENAKTTAAAAGSVKMVGLPIIQQKPKCFEPTWHVECEVRLRAKTYFRVFVSYKTHRIATNIHLSPNQCIKMKQMPKNWLSQDSYFLSTCLV